MSNIFKEMNTKQKCGCVLLHVLVVAWMLVIFCFSAQPADASADLSGSISHLFMRLINFVFCFGWDEATLLEMAYMWDYPIRKLAHMTEFGILAVLIYFLMRYYGKFSVTKKKYVDAWLLTVCYACTDEFHQLFVPGRSGNLFDVGVDSTGALLALVCLYIVQKIYMKIRKR